MRTPRPRRRTAGFGLLDALIALVILSVGLLGLTRLQARSLSYGTEADQRVKAVQLGSELLSTAMVDSSNPGCYLLPTAGTCTSDAAKTYAATVKTRVASGLPGGTVTVTYDATKHQMKIVITWTGKGSRESGASDTTRRMEASTYV
ncbi:MAG: pilus assembly protein PilV [Rubrivivax sp.]